MWMDVVFDILSAACLCDARSCGPYGYLGVYCGTFGNFGTCPSIVDLVVIGCRGCKKASSLSY